VKRRTARQFAVETWIEDVFKPSNLRLDATYFDPGPTRVVDKLEQSGAQLELCPRSPQSSCKGYGPKARIMVFNMSTPLIL